MNGYKIVLLKAIFMLYRLPECERVCSGICKAEQHTVIHATIGTEELAKVHQCTADHIKAEKELLEEHSKKLAKHLQSNEGIWLSSRWLIFVVIVLAVSYLAVILWAIDKEYCNL